VHPNRVVDIVILIIVLMEISFDNKKHEVYKQLPENTPSPTQAEWDLIVEKSTRNKNIYKDIGHVLEVVALIALLILMAAYVEPRFNF